MLHSFSWSRTAITYSVNDGINYDTSLIENAFDYWEAISPFRFTRLAPGQSSDFVFVDLAQLKAAFPASVHGDEAGLNVTITDSGNITPVISYIGLDAGASANLNDQWVATHEIGHGLGLVDDYQADPNQTIYSLADPQNDRPQARDIQDLQGRYGASPGDDEILAGAGSGRVSGGDGEDTISAGAGDDVAYGNLDADLIFGGAGADTLFGGADADTLDGGDSDDVIYGNLDVDRLAGGAGNDTLYGGKMSDALSGGDGDDILIGGADADLFYFSTGEGSDVIVDFDTSADQFVIDAAVLVAQGVQDVATLLDRHLTIDANGDVLLDLGNGGSVIFAGLSSSEVLAGDFLLG